MTRTLFSAKSKFLAAGFACALATAALCGPALAQEDTTTLDGDNKVVATVNGYEIKASEVRMAYTDVLGQLPNLPPKLRYPFVVEFLVERHLLAQIANKEGLADSEDYKRRLAAYQAKALRDSYLAQSIAPKITEEMIRKVYDDEAKRVSETERVRARHVLVGSEKEANTILEKLKKGEKFEDLAKQFSLDGSKDYGGDLGYFTEAEMVPAFSKAAFALQKGEMSKPVKTDFGWHIIRVEDRKKGAAQPYDQVKGAIRSALVRTEVQKLLAAQRDTSKVEILDEDLKKVAAEAAAQRKALLDKQNANAVTGEGEAGSTGKGDLLVPEGNQ